MPAIDILDKKIADLQKDLEQIIEANKKDQEQINEQLAIIRKCEKVVNNEDLLITYDFNDALQLLKSYRYDINKYIKIISDVQLALLVRKKEDLTKGELLLADSQISVLQDFLGNLETIGHSVVNHKLRSTEELEKKVTNLKNLRNILVGNQPNEAVTSDMFATFYEELDLMNMPPDDARELLEMFYQTKNLSNEEEKEQVNFNDVINLYQEYLPSSSMRYFNSLLNTYQEEIVNNIKLDNTRKILQFFKEENLINKFKRTALLKVSLYGDADYIKNDIYHKIRNNHSQDMDAYFEDYLASVWIKKENSNVNQNGRIRIITEIGEKKETKSLYTTCHTVNYDEFEDNIKTLKDNRDLFADSVDLDSLGANLELKTLPVQTLKNNLEVARLYKLNNLSGLTGSCLVRGNIEDKINLGIELGLLEPPMTKEFLELDKKIVRNDEFQRNSKNKNLYNQSIRNYFKRYLTSLTSKPISEYAILANKLQKMGYLDFYNEFFSNVLAGKGNPAIITAQDKSITSSKEKMAEYISTNFVSDWYSENISKYDEYDKNITDNGKNNLFGYIDASILEDDLIKELEENNTVKDLIRQNDTLIERKNEFVYLFANRIISRYKVLHNATVLKNIYGTLNKEMLMTSIVRNSFLDEDSFQAIKEQVLEGGKKR